MASKNDKAPQPASSNDPGGSGSSVTPAGTAPARKKSVKKTAAEKEKEKQEKEKEKEEKRKLAEEKKKQAGEKKAKTAADRAAKQKEQDAEKALVRDPSRSHIPAQC